MNSSRKPKPPDKGAPPPEHKPSRKVALEEVMRSLQDLVNNELATDSLTPAEPPKRRRSDQTPPEAQSPIPNPASEDQTNPEIESITLEGLSEAPAQKPPEPNAPVPAPRTPPSSERDEKEETPAPVPPGGIQQDLPYLDSVPELGLDAAPAAIIADTEAPPTSLPEALASLDDMPSLPTSIPEPERTSPAPTSADTAPALIPENWDDIPVLEEAVDLAELNAGGGETLPAASDARRLAIQVAARLNVELRKSGQAGLSSEIITRLARMLEEALAKPAPKVENKRPEKH